MMLRWAARISCGSAFAIAFRAASRSPCLIASSTVRTAPRIWVRRDLLTMVRRAILRVAFLAEVVLAMLQDPSAAIPRRNLRVRVTCREKRPDRRDRLSGRLSENAMTAAEDPIGAAQRTAAAGSRLPPFRALIKPGFASVNGLARPKPAESPPSVRLTA